MRSVGRCPLVLAALALLTGAASAQPGTVGADGSPPPALVEDVTVLRAEGDPAEPVPAAGRPAPQRLEFPPAPPVPSPPRKDSPAVVPACASVVPITVPPPGRLPALPADLEKTAPPRGQPAVVKVEGAPTPAADLPTVEIKDPPSSLPDRLPAIHIDELPSTLPGSTPAPPRPEPPALPPVLPPAEKKESPPPAPVPTALPVPGTAKPVPAAEPARPSLAPAVEPAKPPTPAAAASAKPPTPPAEPAKPSTPPAKPARPAAAPAKPAALPATEAAKPPTPPADKAGAPDETHADEDGLPGFCWFEPKARLQRLAFFGDFLYLKPRGTDVIYGQPRDGLTPISAPLGPQGVLEPGYAPGFRAGLQYVLTPGSAVEASFAWWENQTHSFLGLPPGAPPGSVIQSTVTLPSLMNVAADSLTAAGSSGQAFRTADVAYQQYLCGGCSWYTVNWLAGVRYATLRQDLNGEFTILGTTDVDTRINFDGVGPRLGLDGELLGKYGVRLYARTAGSLLAGHFGGSYNQFNVFAGQQGNIDYKSDRIVPVWELELGVGWVSPKGRVRVLCGYYLATWFDTVVTPDFIAAVRANNFSTGGGNLQGTLAFDGLTARVEFWY